MREELKRVILQAFDSGELRSREAEYRHAVKNQPELERLLNRLLGIEDVLGEPESPEVPEGFAARVIGSLPAARARRPDLRTVRSLVLFGCAVAGLVAAILLSPRSGIDAGLSSLLARIPLAEEVSVQLTFLVTSAIGILFVTWLFVTSFFGIRSRRITR